MRRIIGTLMEWVEEANKVIERTRAARRSLLNEGGPHTMALATLARDLREEPAYLESGADGITLVKTSTLRVVLEVLRSGHRLAEHQVPGSVTLHLLEGEVRLQSGEEVSYVVAGELLALPANHLHTVEAVKDCVFLLHLGVATKSAEAPIDVATAA